MSAITRFTRYASALANLNTEVGLLYSTPNLMWFIILSLAGETFTFKVY